jgi:hydrogenase expression/formation protein HypD
MKYIDEFRNPYFVNKLIYSINKLVLKDKIYKIMEICGTHTMAIAKYGLKELLPGNIELISGPGCPVCVIPQGEIDAIFALLGKEDVVLYTYGDLIRTPGSNNENLLTYKAKGADVRIVLSPMDILKDIEKNNKEHIFISIGFETTAPAVAFLIKEIYSRKITNFSIFPYNKVMPGILDVILNEKDLKVDGFICPGHVAAIAGPVLFDPIVRKNKAAVIAGFEITDILIAIREIVLQVNGGQFEIVNRYKRVVTDNGNSMARTYIEEIFNVSDSMWRGVGFVKMSGLALKKQFQCFDAINKYDIVVKPVYDKKGCKCGEVLMGKIKPFECMLFSRECTPETPVGPCMVSTEGTCAAYYKYNYMVRSGNY